MYTVAMPPEGRISKRVTSTALILRLLSQLPDRLELEGEGEHTMLRYLRMSVGLVLLLFVTVRDAHAQWGYGGWGWGGWGASTPIGDAGQAAGMYAAGAGMYNLDTAQARSINADTVMRFNDYVANAALQSAYMYNSRKAANIQHNKEMYNARQRMLRDNPDRVDIENGNALNAAVDDLNNPKIGDSALRASRTPVSASLIAEVPFVYASERVTFMLDHIREAVKWPEVFENKQFVEDEKTFDALRAKIRKEADEGEVKPKTLRDANNFLDALRAKVDANPLPDPLDQKDALNFISTGSSLIGMMQKPDIQPALLDLRKVSDTTIGNLLGFMHAYNLRFGAATTPKERQAFHRLWEILDGTRDEVLAAAGIKDMPGGRMNPQHAHDFFQGLNQARKPSGNAPQPPKPAGAQ
jgi:hypothetical protein